VIARAVGDMRRVVVASPRYLKARGTPQKLSDLADHEVIRFSGSSALAEWRFMENGREIRVPNTSRFATNSTDAAVLHAEQGGGLISVLAYQVAESLKAGRLRIVLAKYELPTMPIHLVYPTSRLLSAKVRAFIDLVVANTDWRFGTK
jgi:DNA-binding transcriptional LysR family regulator